MKVIQCDGCKKVIDEEKEFHIGTFQSAELIEGKVCGKHPILVDELHFCSRKCFISTLYI